MTSPTARRDLIAWAEARGWRYTVAGSGHLRWQRPDVPRVVFSSHSPSDPRALANARAAFRRAERQGR